MPESFDVESARKSGYTDDEILSHLTKTRKFDIEGATKAGYSKADIISHLSAAPKTEVKEDPGFVSGLYESTLRPGVGAVRSLATMGPYESRSEAVAKGAQGILEAAGRSAFTEPWEYAKKTGQAMLQGDVMGAVRNAPGMVPIVGPLTEEITNMVESGQPRRALGNVAGFLAPTVASKFIPRLRVPGVKNVLTPAEKQAIAAQPGVKSVGQLTGQKGLQRVEHGLVNLPGSATRASEFYKTQAGELQARGQSLAGRVSPVQTDKVGAGSAVEDRLTNRITRLKGQTDAIYNSVRADASAAQKTIQTGVKTTTSPVLGPSGKPIVTETPIFATFDAPVDMAPIRSALLPIHDDLLRAMPEARRLNSPGWKVLDELIRSDQPYMNAMDWDKSLGAIKALTRNGESPYLTTQSQRVAKQIVAQGEKGLESALGSAGPDVYKKLQTGRNLVKAYHETAETLGDLRFIKYGQAEPAVLFKHLTEGGDTVLRTLTELNKTAPKELKVVGRTLLEDISSKPNPFDEWQKLGPRTKQLIYGPTLTKDLNEFFLATKMLAGPKASGAHMLMAAGGGMGAVGLAAQRLLAGDVTGAAAVTTGAFITPNIVSRLLFTPRGVRLMTQGINAPIGSPAFYKVSAGLNALLWDLGKREQEPAH